MSKTLKETLLGACVNGENVLNELAVARQMGKDFRINKNGFENTINSLHPTRLSLVVTEINEISPIAKQIRFASKDGYLPPFEAGQFINIFTEVDGVCTSRPYSISSSPRQRAYYEITVARISTGFVSDYMLDNVKVGDEFEATSPSGSFHYNPVFHSKTSVMLAGGSGITPFKSMISEVLDAGLDREIYLLYGVRNTSVALYNDLFSDYAKKHSNFHYYLVVSDDETYEGEKGFINEQLIKKLIPDVNAVTYYICGPRVMNEFCENELLNMNIPIKKIRREMFGASGDVTKEVGFPTDITGEEVFKVTVEGKVIDAKANETLLTALERAGIKVNVCCRSGECSMCRVKLVSGKVFLSKGTLLRQADEKFGYIHSCKAYPITDLEIML